MVKRPGCGTRTAVSKSPVLRRLPGPALWGSRRLPRIQPTGRARRLRAMLIAFCCSLVLDDGGLVRSRMATVPLSNGRAAAWSAHAVAMPHLVGAGERGLRGKGRAACWRPARPRSRLLGERRLLGIPQTGRARRLRAVLIAFRCSVTLADGGHVTGRMATVPRLADG
jgi:hypothetical protein